MGGRRLLAVCGAVLAVATGLAGCMAGPTGPPVGTEAVPEDAPQEAGDGDYALTLRITDEPGGDPIEGAAVIAYWGDGDSDAEASFEAEGDSPGGSGSVDAVVRADVQPRTPPTDNTLPARTGPDGTATLNLPSNDAVGIVASAPAHTEEWIPRAGTGDAGEGGTATLPVYDRHIANTTEASWDIAGASPGAVTGSDYDWEPREVSWGHNQEAREGYVERLAELRVTVNWTNGPDGGGDLAAAAGTSTGQPDLLEDAGDEATPGDHSEQLVADTSDIDEGGVPASSTLYVGPATDSAYVAPNDLAYTVHTEARFDPFAQPATSTDGPNASSGVGLAALPAIAIPALLVARRRPR